MRLSCCVRSVAFLLGRCDGWFTVQFSCSVVSDSLWPHGLHHARFPCPSPTPGACSNSCPSSRWCHPTVSSSVIPFSSCPQSLPASGSFPMSQLFAWGGQSIGVSASTSVLQMNTQGRSPLGWTGWISLQSKGLSRVFSNTTVQKHQFFSTQLSLWSNSHPYMTTGKTIVWRTFVSKVIYNCWTSKSGRWNSKGQAREFSLAHSGDTRDWTTETGVVQTGSISGLLGVSSVHVRCRRDRGRTRIHSFFSGKKWNLSPFWFNNNHEEGAESFEGSVLVLPLIACDLFQSFLNLQVKTYWVRRSN